MGRTVVVGVGEMAVSGKAADELVTHSLGSCLGVAIHDPVARVGGLLHIMLPHSRLNPQRAEAHPCLFADTGLPRLFRAAYALGARKRRLRVVLAGGAQSGPGNDRYQVGQRNYAAVRRLLWRNEVLVAAAEVGGSHSRTLRLAVASGEITMHILPDQVKLL